ncbi:hypothetical protein PWT90_01088 [Aphanocladium album]|nr:hypothetical protein PWT90_01088 [Aphanocladium album]
MSTETAKPCPAEHFENMPDTLGHDSRGLYKSPFDQLSLPQTLWTFKRIILVTLAVYTGYVCEGFELGAGASIVANRGFIKQFGDHRGGTQGGVRALNPTWVSTWSAFLNVGQIVTFTHISWFADRFGRKASLYLAWTWLVAGCVLLNTARTPGVWALAKLCNGAGIGVLQVVCQVYVMEIAPNRIRGGLVTFQAVWSNAGSIVCSVMMQQLNKTYPDNYLLAMRILWVPVGLMILCWVCIPESPWFHTRYGDKDKAIKCMRQLYGGVPGFDFEEEFKSGSYSIAKLALQGISQQLVGLAIISTYSTLLMWSLSTDKLGRRTIINVCETFICVILFLVGGLYWAGATDGNAAAATALLVICCFWTFSFQIIAMSYYLFSAELPSALLRAIPSWELRLGRYATPPMLLSLGVRAGFVFGAFSVPICILMWLYIPETKGRSAAEIDELYERKIPAWRWQMTVTNTEKEMYAMIEKRAGA